MTLAEYVNFLGLKNFVLALPDAAVTPPNKSNMAMRQG
jgi:hypothetical protein